MNAFFLTSGCPHGRGSRSSVFIRRHDPARPAPAARVRRDARHAARATSAAPASAPSVRRHHRAEAGQTGASVGTIATGWYLNTLYRICKYSVR